MPIESVTRLVSQGLFHSALEVLDTTERVGSTEDNASINAELLNEKGKLFYLLSDYRQAIRCFSEAIDHAKDHDMWVKYQVNLAAAYRQMNELDTAHRYLGQLQAHLTSMAPRTRGHYLLNLSAIQGLSGLHEQVVENIQASIRDFSDANIHRYDLELYNNLGLSYREMGHYEASEAHLQRALNIDSKMHTCAELGRLYFKIGQTEQSIHYSQVALSKVWGSFIDFEKEELASLCHLLAQLCVFLNEVDLAQQLAEKAQVYYGQLGLWRPWQEIESEMAEWMDAAPSVGANTMEASFFDAIEQFISWLNAVNAQELIHPRISRLLDTRVHYVQVLAGALALSSSDVDDLIVASRFADYGLTALETDVVLNPNRSAPAYEQYKLHPTLSVRLMETLHVPQSIVDIVSDHHERFRGSGYPHGKTGDQIHPLARVFAIADTYATGVVLDGHPHSRVIADMAKAGADLYDPHMLTEFIHLF